MMLSQRRCARLHKANLDHAASADGAQIEAMTSEDGVALGSRQLWQAEAALARQAPLGCARVWRRGRRSPGTKMTDAAKPLRQYVEQKATNELLSLERHHFGFVAGADNPSSGSGRGPAHR